MSRNLFPSMSQDEFNLVIDSLQAKERRLERNLRTLQIHPTALNYAAAVVMYEQEIARIRELLGHLMNESM